MKITILAVGSEAQYQPTFDTAYQYLKKETAALSAELSYAICRPDAAELFAALRNAMGQSEAVVLLLSPEPAAVSTALRVVCGGLERTAQTDAALQKQLEARAVRMGLTLGYEQLADFASHRNAQLGIEVAERLVEQEGIRLADDGAPHGDALPLATGKLLRLAREERLDLQHARRFGDTGINVCLGDTTVSEAIG